MKPAEGRRRVVIDDVQPQLNGGRYAVKRVIGDVCRVTTVLYGDGHDHVAARLLYRHTTAKHWSATPLRPLENDLWEAEFTVDALGEWRYTVEGWIDHFDTWHSDLVKRLDAQPAVSDDLESGGAAEGSSDLRLAFQSGALLLEAAASRAGGEAAKTLNDAASKWREIASQSVRPFTDPLTEDVLSVVRSHPDLSFATVYAPELTLWVDREKARFSTWYELFPRSLARKGGEHGRLTDVIDFLPEVTAMGFDVLYLPPIHPIGTAFRKGKNNSVTAQPDDLGSPWAIGNVEGGHTAIHPALGTFQDFDALVKATKEHGMELAMDIAFQCSPDHPWVKTHPDWFSIRPDGSIQYAENPPKKYQDIYPLNFESKDWRGLWQELYSVFLFWIKRGVRIFRVDNPHTKAMPFWEWCIAEIRKKYPETIFLAEAFTRPHVMYGLAKAGFTQSYTYFSWRNTKQELEEYAKEVTAPPVSEFFRPNFWPNTPDILPEHLQTGGRPVFIQRAVLAATLAANYGVYGPAFELGEHLPLKPGGEEYLHSEKYQIRMWDRKAEGSIAPVLAKLNQIRKEHPALQTNETLRFHPIENDQLLCYSKTAADNDVVLVVVNLDGKHPQSAWTNLDLGALGLGEDEFEAEEQLSGERYVWRGPHNYVLLDPAKWPAHVLVLRKISRRSA